MSNQYEKKGNIRTPAPLALILIIMIPGLCRGKESEYNLTLTISGPTEQIKQGDEIPVIFRITNKGPSTYTYEDRNGDRGGRMEEYMLTAEYKDRAANNAQKKVPDPREKYTGGIGGGLTGQGQIKPGESFTKTIALNRWALIKKPCRYRVTGFYLIQPTDPNHKSITITSPTIEITVKPRSDREIADYIRDLEAQLKNTKTDKDEIIKKLMYTCDRRIIPILIDSMYKDRSGFWASEGLLYYLPREPKLKQIILNTARNRGFGANMPYVLRQLGCSDKEIKPMVSLSLSSKYPATLIEGALAAQVYPNDEHAPKLIAIAMDPNSPARHQAIYAIAWNRTEQGVRALKQLLKDPDKDIRINTDHAIRSAYKRHSNKGRPLRDDDFEEMFRKQKEKKKS